MAKLVIGTNKQNGVPAVVRDLSPEYYVEKKNQNGTLTTSDKFIKLDGITTLGRNVLNGSFKDSSLTGAIDMSSITEIQESGANSICTGSTGITLVNLSNLTTVGSSGLSNAFQNCTGITSVDLSSLTTVGNGGLNNAFAGCNHITGHLDLSNLTTVGNGGLYGAFYGDTSITSVDLSNLTTVTDTWSLCDAFRGCSGLTGHLDLHNLTNGGGTSTFYGCNNITSVDLSGLVTLSISFGSIFQNCNNLENVNVSNLTTCTVAISQFVVSTSVTKMSFESLTDLHTVNSDPFSYMLRWNYKMKNVYFYALDTNSFGNISDLGQNMLQGVTDCTVHFPIRTQSTISQYPSVISGFGGTRTVVVYDLVTSIIGNNSITYARQQKSSTQTTTAWIYNSILYYTSGTSEPTVGDIIYSDASCTTAVTTISSIA